MLYSGYLISPRDLCGLNYIPSLIKANVKSLKIEGRMKNPEYVATVTKVYKKYINLAYTNPEEYSVENSDIKDLMQAFNRGSFSSGNFENEPNKTYVYSKSSNNTGLYVGNISHINNSKGLITFKLNDNTLEINDKISFENEDHKYTISELMVSNKNVKVANPNDIVTIGRMKGNLHPGDKIYKLSNAIQNKLIFENFNKENKKIPLVCSVRVKKGLPLFMEITSCDKEDGSYFSMSASAKEDDIIPIDAISNPISIDRIKEQINKTTDTQFEFKYIKIDLDDNTYVSKLSAFNKLRRECLGKIEEQAINRYRRNNSINSIKTNNNVSKFINENKKKTISLLFNRLNLNYDYSKIKNINDIDSIYIPINYLKNQKYFEIINYFSKTNAKLYIYLPTILKDNFRNYYFNDINSILKEFNIKGLVLSNLSCINYFNNYKNKLDIVSNYTFNVFNNYTIDELRALGVNKITLSPELNESDLKKITSNSNYNTEILVYGRLPLMNIGYCPLGKSNKCYPTCDMKCKSNDTFYLKDRLNMKFRIIPDNIQTISTIYNSKITSIDYSNINCDSVRISILDESVPEIVDIIDNVKNNKVFKGSNYSSIGFNKNV